MSLSIRIFGSHQQLQADLARELQALSYDIANELPDGGAKPTFGIICIGAGEQLNSETAKHIQACQYPVVLSLSEPQAGSLAEYFRQHIYAYLVAPGDGRDAGSIANTLHDQFQDILYMARVLEGTDSGPASPRLWSCVLADGLPEGVAVIDRQFRTWYRNKAHLQIAGESDMGCPLCWVQYHGLAERPRPCDGCPSATLFATNTNKTTNPTPMIIGFDPPEDDKRPARATEVQVIPLFDESRARVVGAVEIVRNISSEFSGKGPRSVTITACVELVLRKVFLSRFRRARLFLLSPNGNNWLGFAAVGDPPPSFPIKSLRVPKDSNVTGPGPHFRSQPAIVHTADFAGKLPQYCEAFDKVNAPCWGDIPFADAAGTIIGKVVVDRWSRNPEEQEIREGELAGFAKGLQLLAEILGDARAIQNAKERIAVAEATEELLISGLKATSKTGVQAAYAALLNATQAIPGVVSAVIREQTVETLKKYQLRRGQTARTILRYVDGFGAYSRHCVQDLPIDESQVAGAVASDPNEHSVVVQSAPDTLKIAKRRIQDVKPPSDQDELKKISYQGTFRIGFHAGNTRPSFLSVQASTFNVFEHETLRLLPRAADLTLALHQFTTELSSCFLAVMELHDVDTGTHSRHVAHVARILAADVKGATPERAYVAGCLHDIGKIGLSRDILRGRARLTSTEEWYVRAHVEVGRDVLEGFSQLEDIRRAVGEHHRWFDGSGGYPREVGGEYQISALGRILAVADCLEAMTSPTRYYKQAKPLPKARAILEEEAGIHFCPEVVDALAKHWAEIESYLDQQRQEP